MGDKLAGCASNWGTWLLEALQIGEHGCWGHSKLEDLAVGGWVVLPNANVKRISNRWPTSFQFFSVYSDQPPTAMFPNLECPRQLYRLMWSAPNGPVP